MIDIHTHILPNVDDGSCSVEDSINGINSLTAEGVTDIVLTPHSRFDLFKPKEVLQSEFERFSDIYAKQGGSAKLYLGQEIYYVRNVEDDLNEGKLLTINGTRNVLVEFSTFQKTDIVEACYNLKMEGYIPVVAHVERYGYIDENDIMDIKDMGGKISVNSNFVNKQKNPFFYKVVKNLLKKDLVDIVASDFHVGRSICFLSAREYIEKKFGTERAEKLFNENPKSLLK